MYPETPISSKTYHFINDTERIIGNWLQIETKKRSEIILATKITGKRF